MHISKKKSKKLGENEKLHSSRSMKISLFHDNNKIESAISEYAEELQI